MTIQDVILWITITEVDESTIKLIDLPFHHPMWMAEAIHLQLSWIQSSLQAWACHMDSLLLHLHLHHNTTVEETTLVVKVVTLAVMVVVDKTSTEAVTSKEDMVGTITDLHSIKEDIVVGMNSIKDINKEDIKMEAATTATTMDKVRDGTIINIKEVTTKAVTAGVEEVASH